MNLSNGESEVFRNEANVHESSKVIKVIIIPYQASVVAVIQPIPSPPHSLLSASSFKSDIDGTNSFSSPFNDFRAAPILAT